MSSSTRIEAGNSSPPDGGGSRRLKRRPLASMTRGGRPLVVLTAAAVLTALEGCSTLHTWGVAIRAIKPVQAAASSGPAQSTDIPLPLARSQPAQEPPPDVPARSSNVDVHKDSRDVRHVSAVGTPTTLGATEVGYYMDVLQGRLTQEVGKDAYIERHGDSIVVLLPVGFDMDSAQINASGRDLLRHLAAVLAEYRLTLVVVQVRGPGSDAHGQSSRLETDRVTALSRVLTDAGVSGKRIESGEAPTLQAAAPPAPGTGVHIELQLSPIGGAL